MIRPVVFAFATAGVWATTVVARGNPSRIVDLGYAKYQTDVSLESGVTSFLGIRFAAPPTGDLRWKLPRKPSKIPGLQNATAQPNQCPQAGIGLAPSNPFESKSSLRKRDDGTSEDCLFINVHVPSESSSNSSLPVVVWIHGGGYVAGSDSLYPGQNFVAESNYSVVAVNIQYRLGVFGFLPGREVKHNGVLNVGLLDQQFALQWVQDNIALFGGDPSKVTIWGSSSGAGSVLQHIVAHGGHSPSQLFRGAIMSSPFLPFQYHYNDEIPEKIYSEVVDQANCTKSQDTIACLRAADVSLLTAADTEITVDNFVGTYAFVPVVDETFIVERPTVTLKRGHVNGDTLLVMTNSQEGLIFVNETVLGPVNYTFPEYAAQLFPHLNKKELQTVVDIYSTDEFPTVEEQASAAMGESILTCPGYFALKPFGEKGWKGEFAIAPGTHGLDLSYEFTTFLTPPTYTNQIFQRAFSQSFLSVVTSLNPNAHFDPSNITPQWDSWGSNLTEMLFNKTATDAPDVRSFQTSAELLKRCQYWASVAAVNAQ